MAKLDFQRHERHTRERQGARQASQSPAPRMDQPTKQTSRFNIDNNTGTATDCDCAWSPIYIHAMYIGLHGWSHDVLPKVGRWRGDAGPRPSGRASISL